MLKKAIAFAFCILFVSALITGSGAITGYDASAYAAAEQSAQPSPIPSESEVTNRPAFEAGTARPSTEIGTDQSASGIDPHKPAEGSNTHHPPADTASASSLSDDTPTPPASPDGAIPEESRPSGSDAQAADDPSEGSCEPEVVTDRLPPPDKTKPGYIEFRKDILGIIAEAQRKSRLSGDYGVFVMDLTTGLYCGLNENLTRIDEGQTEGYFNSASVIKLFQGYILCDMLRRGELDEERYYHDEVTGRRFRLLPMMSYMISHSDNNYSNAVMRLVGNTKSNEVLNRLGIRNSRIYGEMSGAIGYSRKNNLARYGTEKRCARITPRDAGLILYNVYINKETDPYLGTLHEGLLGNIYNTRIPVGVRRVSKSYAIAHKTGTNSGLGVYNDAGIIYCKNPFILVAFTQSATCSAGEAFIRSLAEDLTLYFDAKTSP